MNKRNAKLTKLLIATCCCFGVGVAALQANNVVANAATTEELTAEITNDGQFAFGVSSKTDRGYSIIDGSAAQSTLPAGYSGAVMEVYHSSGVDGYDFITLDFTGKQVVAMDVLSIKVRMWVDIFHSASDEVRTIGAVTGTQRQYGIGAYDLSTWCDVPLTAESIKDMTDANGYLTSIDLGLRDKGGASHLYIDSITIELATYKEVNVGKLALYGNSLSSPATNRLYVKAANGAKFEDVTDKNFTYHSGTGFNVNGTKFTNYVRLRTKDYLCFYPEETAEIKTLLTDETKPDMITIGGSYVNKELGIKYIIEDTQFIWTGTAWEPYVEYNTHELGTMKYYSKGSSSYANAYVYLTCVEGTVPKANDTNGGWDTRFSWKDGIGVTLNGESISATVKFPGSMFIDLAKSPSVGDVLRVGGTFYNATTADEYIVAESAFEWNGEKWVNYIEYETYTVTKVGGWIDGTSTFLYSNDVTKLPSGGDWSSVYTFKAGSGKGITFNGETVTTTDIKQPGDFYIGLGKTPVAGDILTIDGTYYNEAKAQKFVFVDCKVQFDGEYWVEYVPETPEIEYTTYTVTKVGGSINGTQTFLYSLGGDALPKDTGEWDSVFTFEAGSGKGITFNGETITTTDIKQPGDLYIGLGKTPVAGDILTIDGTYYNEAKAQKFVFVDCKAQFNGTKWVHYVEYTIHNLGELAVHSNSNGTTSNVPNATQLYMKIANGMAIPYPDANWDTEFILESGAGWKLNGADINDKVSDIESTNSGLYVNLANANVQVGDVLSVEGTFACSEEGVTAKYVITESKFLWNGTAWENYVGYTTHELGQLNFIGFNGDNIKFPQFNSVNGVKIPAPTGEWVAYQLESGVGVKINDAAVAVKVKFPSSVFLDCANIAAPVEGDKLTIGGTFYNESEALKFVIEESTFWFDGTVWSTEEPIKYTTHELGAMDTCWPSSSIGDAKANQLYLTRADGAALPFKDWGNPFVLESGDGLKVNGEKVSISDMQSSPAGVFIAFSAVNVGDIVSISGTFRCEKQALEYIIEESTFVWNGSFWFAYVEGVAEEELEVYDVVSLSDVSMGMKLSLSGTVDKYVSKKFTTSADNTTNSVAFRFGYNCADVAAEGSNLCFRLRGSAWQGVKFWIANGKIALVDTNKSYALASNTYYEIELGAISMKDSNVWTYVKVDGILALSEVISTSQFSEFDDFATTGFTNHFSLYCKEVAETTLTDVSNVEITYASSAGAYTQTARKGDTFVLPTGKTSGKTFIGWAYNGKLYEAGAECDALMESVTFTAVELDFTMEDGAAIRIASTANESGIRFTTYIKESEYNALIGQYGITNISYGTLIMPYDYLDYSEVPNLEEFNPDESQILKIANTKNEIKDGYIIFRGAMKKLHEANYERLFAGRAYMEITLESGETLTIYTPFNYEDNVRSIRGIAQAFKEDTSTPANENELRYATLSDAEKAVVDTYAATGEIKLMNYSTYANNSMNLTAWYYPALDESNAYNNATNIAITDKMKAAGIKVVYLDGMHHLDLTVVKNVEKTRQMIEFFWSQGLKTIAFGANSSEYLNLNYPDYSACEGFMGFLVWDEPTSDKFGTLAELAKEFETAYAGTDVTFMVNLLPSYASIFNGTTNWWESTLSSLNKEAFKKYLQDYCDIVLSQVSGEKWLSLDSYPINENKTLLANFLFDVAMLKYYAEINDAHAHMVLQSSGWTDSGKDRMPTAAEMEMQAYAAMAFGIDSISWWSYSDKRLDNQKNPTDNDEYYQAFAAANNEIAAIQQVYSAFDWKGIILGAGKNNGSNLGDWVLSEDNDYAAYALVQGQIGDYELSASDTKHLASVSTNKTDWNYLMGVMEDANGNEGYVLCNYNSHEKDRAQTITLTFDSNITEVVIYRNGVAETVSVNNKTLAVNLATGEGVIILPSKLG